tara:strand:+ start:2398 stop:2949 length:552 start_codon:yes stop_codon:yes gene_type:complete
MSNKTNEEKISILQQRLSEIKQKKEKSEIKEKQEIKESKSTSPEIEIAQEKIPMSFGWLKYSIITLCIAFGGYYAYNNINLTLLKTEETNITKEALIETPLKYNLDLKGDNIVITGTFEDESLAERMTEDLKSKGFQSNYFYLPNKSNSIEKVFKVFIGPYEHIEETNQWIKNLEMEFQIIPL